MHEEMFLGLSEENPVQIKCFNRLVWLTETAYFDDENAPRGHLSTQSFLY